MRFQLSPANAAEHLMRRLGPIQQPLRVAQLQGGVSSIVLRAEAGNAVWILKQPRERFRVLQEWRVDLRRAEAEARFAQAMQDSQPGLVARLIDHDPSTHVLILEPAPKTFQPWKQRLMENRFEPRVAGLVGDLLAKIHSVPPDPVFHEPSLFQQQRLDPYFSSCAKKHPFVASVLAELSSLLQESRVSLIHGDFSPKNLLTDGSQVLLVDHEVATLSDPRFDVAFLLSHLLLKAFRGAPAEPIQELAEEFLYRYGRGAGRGAADNVCARLVAALMLARVDGKSPVEYLSTRQQERVRLFALAALPQEQAVEDLVVEALKRPT